MLIYGMHGKPLMGNIQKLSRFENPRNGFIVACPSGPAYGREMAATPEKSDLGNIPAGAQILRKTRPEHKSRAEYPKVAQFDITAFGGVIKFPTKRSGLSFAFFRSHFLGEVIPVEIYITLWACFACTKIHNKLNSYEPLGVYMLQRPTE